MSDRSTDPHVIGDFRIEKRLGAVVFLFFFNGIQEVSSVIYGYGRASRAPTSDDLVVHPPLLAYCMVITE